MAKKQPIIKQTTSITEEQLADLRALLPHVFTEGKIDFEKLHTTLGDFGNENPERYSFSWAGKRDSIRILQTPSRATLIPARKESVDFDQTQNIFIEGDNLEVLKLLYKPYFGQAKMIYIDPPYNTGNDFVYPDNFADPLDTYLKLTGQKDSEGNLLTSNAETSGRYHSAWLSMMYPRLFLARQLLREDGVIFISIDDNEVHNLRLIMNEIFGEENHVGTIIWKKHAYGRGDTFIIPQTEYVFCYVRDKKYTSEFGLSYSKDRIPEFQYEDSRGKYRLLRLWHTSPRGGYARPTLQYNLTTPDGHPIDSVTGQWLWSKSRMESEINKGNVVFVEQSDNTIRAFKKDHLQDDRTEKPTSLFDKATTDDATKDFNAIMPEVGETLYTKPAALIKHLISSIGSTENEIILDFFSGSATTAQSILELNREDSGNRKFILVQLPEPTSNKEFPTIAEIGKERIRRVIKKMKKEREGQLKLDKPEDLGFKVFKLRESNYKQWDGNLTGPAGKKSNQKDSEEDLSGLYAKQMEMLADPLVKGWKEEDVLYEVALKEGYGLNVIVGDTEVKGIQKVSDPDKEQSFYLCLDDKVKLKDIKALNLKKDDLFICRDIALDDETAANLSLQCRLKTI